MRSAPRLSAVVICAGALAAVLLLTAGCNRSSGGTRIIRTSPFSVAAFPLTLDTGADTADVAFDSSRNLLAVSGGETVRRISGETGLETDPVGTCFGEILLSLVASGSTIYVGTNDGRILSIDSDGLCGPEADLGVVQPVTGLVLTQSSFGAARGALLAAAGSAGIFEVDVVGDTAPELLFAPASGFAYHDLAFFQSRLFAIEETTTTQRIAEVFHSATPSTTVFATGLKDGVGLVIDQSNGDLYVADADPGILRTVDMAVGGALISLANHAFDSTTRPSGMAVDGIGTLVFVTEGSAVLRAFRLPPIAFSVLSIERNDGGYGDLEFDADQDLLLTGNNETTDPLQTVLFRVGLRRSTLSTLETNIPVAGETQRLVSLASHAVEGDVYLGTAHEPLGVAKGSILRRDSSGTVTRLVDLGSPVLGLELAPAIPEMMIDAGPLVATTFDGRVCEVELEPIDENDFDCVELDATAPADDPLPDLVFDRERTLYVLQRGDAARDGAVWTRPDGGVFVELVSSSALGAPAGLDLDEGGSRLLVASEFPASADRVLEVDLPIPMIRTLVSDGVDLKAGAFPSGLVYDGLGSVLVRVRTPDASIQAAAFRIPLAN